MREVRKNLKGHLKVVKEMVCGLSGMKMVKSHQKVCLMESKKRDCGATGTITDKRN